jgi:hypothetical protein
MLFEERLGGEERRLMHLVPATRLPPREDAQLRSRRAMVVRGKKAPMERCSPFRERSLLAGLER